MTQPKDKAKASFLAVLRGMHNKPEVGLGSIGELSETGNKLVAILENSAFTNVSAQWTIYRILDWLARYRILKLVGSDGSSGEIDTSWLNRITDQKLRNKIIDSLLESGKLTGLEYCHVLSGSSPSFTFFGVDDKDLHSQAMVLWGKLAPLWKFIHTSQSQSPVEEAMRSPELGPLFKYFEEFDRVDRQRAQAILRNLLRKMDEMEIRIAVLVCTGNLPKYVKEEAMKQLISFVMINPAIKASGHDLDGHEKELERQLEMIQKS